MRKLFVPLALAALSCSHTPPTPTGEDLKKAAETPAAAVKADATAAANKGIAAGTAQASGAAAAAGSAASAMAAAVLGKSSIDEAALDKSVSPCDDFYQFACGGWIKSTPIPDDRPTWSRSFMEILQRNQNLLHEILEKDARGEADPADPYARKVGDYYATCMDEDKAETVSYAALVDMLKGADAFKDAKGLAHTVARMHAAGAQPFFRFSSTQDFKDSTQVIGDADQGGLGMPDRDYYLNDDAKMVELRKLYQSHIAKMLELAGAAPADAAKEAEAVLGLETKLAKVSLDKVSRRNPDKVYHRLERKGLKAKASHFKWDEYFTTLGVPEVQTINVDSPGFMEGLDAVLAKEKPADLHTYLRWKAVEAAANALGKAFVDERFRYTKALTGAKAQLPRWKRCVAMTDAAMGEALGRTFVTTTIGDEGKKTAKEMIVAIEKAFQDNLTSVAWMDDHARTASVEKISKIHNKVGYPDKWRNYDLLPIARTSLLENQRAAAEFASKHDLAKIGKPVDREEFGMSPPTVNAYYDGSMNEMVFPAGIMQTPFFSTEASIPSNYGGMGMVMGHELTHGFDDEGRKFDGDGNLHEWWSPEVSKAFTERAECVAKQYDGYIAVDDVHLNGHLTLGENLADIGGLKMTLAALRARSGGKPSAPAPAGQWSDDQQLFLSFAQSWCTSYRPEAARTQALTNPHSVAHYRVNGPVTNNPDFAAAFQCKAGAPMAPVNRCSVW